MALKNTVLILQQVENCQTIEDLEAIEFIPCVDDTTHGYRAGFWAAQYDSWWENIDDYGDSTMVGM